MLLHLGQSAFDPASGAAQSMRQWAEALACRGLTVAALSTSACESSAASARGLGLVTPGGDTGCTKPSAHRAAVALTTLVHAGVEHEIVHADPAHPRRWEHDVGDVVAARFHERIVHWRPDLLLTYGDDPGDRRRRALARAHGVRTVFGLHNLAYREPPPDVDRFIAPSAFLARRYGERWPGVAVHVAPTVLSPDAMLAERHEPAWIAFLNPEPAKGAALVARLAQRLGQERPDIPLLVVEGRAGAADFLALARAQGAALASHANLLHAPLAADVRPLWAGCRVLLMPSIVEEAAGRAALEAMANGAVAIVSDRGALPETVGDAGIVLPVDASAHDATPATVARWFDALLALADDDAAFAARSARCRAWASRHLPRAAGGAVEAAIGG